MKTVTKTVKELVDSGEDAPLPLSAIPNHMGINLVSVEALTWTRQDDGQLVSLTIHFTPSKERVRSSPRSGRTKDSPKPNRRGGSA